MKKVKNILYLFPESTTIYRPIRGDCDHIAFSGKIRTKPIIGILVTTDPATSMNIYYKWNIFCVRIGLRLIQIHFVHLLSIINIHIFLSLMLSLFDDLQNSCLEFSVLHLGEALR